LRIRDYTSADFDALRQLHAAQGFGYSLPDPESPLFVTRLVLEDDAEGDGSNNETSRNSGASGEVLDSREVADTNSLPAETPACGEPPRILMAVLLRLTAETYLLHDPSAGTPRQRWQRLLALHEAARCAAAACGLDDVQAFLPPRVARAFGRRLARLGWQHDPWPCFSRRVT
jgi:hypothetical protein